MTFGLTEGWWRFSDHDLRADYPLLSVPSWKKLLADCGFKEAVSLTNQPQLQGSAVIVAQKARLWEPEKELASEQSTVPSPTWLILADKNGVGKQLAQLLSGSRVILAFSGEKYEHLSSQSPQKHEKFTLRGTKDDFERLLEVCPNLHGVVYCWSLDTVEASALTEEALKAIRLT